MLLKTLKTVDLHGTLNLTINFYKDLALLIGVNGSGKTSALNVIDWLLQADLKKLATNKFSMLQLEFEYEAVEYRLKAIKNEKALTLSIASPNLTIKPIVLKLTEPFAPSDPDFYNGLWPEKKEMPMWELLKSFDKPIVISLDRTISAEAEHVFYADSRRNSPPKKTSSRSPIAHVQAVMTLKYTEYRAKAIQHDNELKARIVISALQNPEEVFKKRPTKPMTNREITLLEDKVITYISQTIKTDEITNQVRKFFATSRALAQRPLNAQSDPDQLINFVLSQYQQIENLAKAFNDFEVKNAVAFKEIREYLDAVNRFLADSGKSLNFDDSSGRLVFSFTDPSMLDLPGNAINNLSSGEKQILILFTFLAFVAKKDGVFIVDEPEISLHPKWQHEFMQTFLQLSPPNTQILLATHSPDIVGKYKNYCVPLTKKTHV